MKTKVKIALSVPQFGSGSHHFSFKLKEDIYVERSEYQECAKVFVVSDLDGDFGLFRKILLNNKIIDKNYKWLFRDGHLMILGDCLSSDQQAVECLWFIYSLEERARKQGGRVHFILGNHEISNMNGAWRSVHPKYASTSKTPYNALYYGNNELGRWLQTKNIVEKIGSSLFAHGGVMPQLLSLNLTISEINNIARRFYNHSANVCTERALQVIFNTEQSPFSFQGYYNKSVTEDQIDTILRHFKVNTIVTGHAIVNSVTSFYNGKVRTVGVDNASGNLTALMIKNGEFYKFNNVGKAERIK